MEYISKFLVVVVVNVFFVGVSCSVFEWVMGFLWFVLVLGKEDFNCLYDCLKLLLLLLF